MNTFTRAPEHKSGISRRNVVAGAAWAVPVIVSVTAAPAFAAASGAASITTTTPNMQTPATGSTTVTALVKNASGHPLAGQAVSFSGPQGASFSPVTTTTNSSGIATSTLKTTDAWGLPGSTVTVTALSNGVSGTAALAVLGANAYAVGSNISGKAGVSGTRNLTSPKQLALSFLSPIVSMATGTAFSLALLKDGTVWSVGANDSGQLGDGTRTGRSTWARISSLSGATQIAAGDATGMAVLSDGTIRAWGDNTDGQLGSGTTAANSPSPVTVAGIGSTQPPAVQIALGSSSNYALLADGTVRSWGNNDFGQLGDNTTTGRSTPGSLVFPAGQPSPVKQISAGALSAYALLSDGSIIAWGFNDRGRLGDGSTADSSVPVAVSGITSAARVIGGYVGAYALLSDTSVMAWGGNDSGQLGQGTTDFGDAHPIPQLINGLAGVVQLSAALRGAYALTEDGTIFAWGNNAAIAATSRPMSIGAAQTTANVTRLQDNSSEAQNDTLFLVVGDRVVRALAPTQMVAGSTATVGARVTDAATGASIGGQTVTFSSSTGTVSPASGTTDGSGTTNVSLTAGDAWTTPGTVVTVKATSVGVSGTTDLKLLGANAYALGANESSRLGVGNSTNNVTSPQQLSPAFPSPIASIATGDSFSLALLRDGTVWAVGANGNSQLADGTTTDRSTWAAITGLTNVTQIAAGSSTGYALSGGKVFAWGYNGDGQIGNGTSTNASAPAEVIGISNAAQISAGSGTGYALLTDGTVAAWGRGDWGQLGDGTSVSRSTPVFVSGISDAVEIAGGLLSAYARTTSGKVLSWGINENGQLGDGSAMTDSGGGPAFRSTPTFVKGISSAAQLCATSATAYARLTDGTISAWGRGDGSQLGNGQDVDSTTPVSVQGITNARLIAAGGDTGYALLSDGRILGWGWGDDGELAGHSTSNVPVQLTGMNNVNGFAVNSCSSYGMFYLVEV